MHTTGFAPVQVPLWQVSVVVQALPSEQVVSSGFGGFEQTPVCGLQVIGDLKRIGATAWDAGWIYDPKEGKSYDVEIKPRGPDKLVVTGYLGVKFLSESFVWTRASATTPKCQVATN